MTAILVPLDNHRDLQLRAAYFALEFAKRTGARVLFLNIQPERTVDQSTSRSGALIDMLDEELDDLVNDSLMAGLHIETYVTSGDFVQCVTEFARRHNVSRVILALPDNDRPGSAGAATRLNALKDRLTCALVTVRPRHEAESPTSGAS